MRSLYKRPKTGLNRAVSGFFQEDPLRKPKLPNSCMMRIMEESRAEREADDLSSYVTSTTADGVQEEMGSHLGADFSGVRFHDDSASMSRSRSMGARAWTRGTDVYFGRGGFDPSVAAHELVHTVQQGAIHGNVSQSMPLGVVQMWPEEEKDDINTNSIRDAKKAGVDPLEATLLAIFNTEFGRRCYRDIESKLKEMIQRGAGKPIQNYSSESAVHFLVEGANRVHAAKEILQEIAEKPIETKDDSKERAKEYKYFFKFLTTGLGEFGIEEIAVENQMNSRPAKYEHNRSTKDTRTKRAWELDNHSKNKEEKIAFNPTNDPELEDVQRKIDEARDAKAAYSAFAAFTGNNKAAFKDVTSTAKNLDVNMLKKKLKHMARVVIDYPELRGNIGNMKTMEKKETVKNSTGKKVKQDNQALMATDSTLGNRRKATIYYNAWMDRRGAEDERNSMDREARWNNLLNAHRDYAGTHELGHVLASTLQDPEDETEAIIQQKYNQVESSMLRSAATEAYMHNKMTFEDRQNLKETNHDFTSGREIFEVDTKGSGLAKAGHTSKYGAKNASEFFAEAVSDVYAHGKDAKPMSIEIVKEYEKRRTDATKKNFFIQQKNQPGFFKKYFGWLKFW